MDDMKRNRKRIPSFIFICMAIILLFFSFLNIAIPQQIRIIAGQEHYFHLNIPIEANIQRKNLNVLNVNHQKIENENFHLSLNEPFSLESQETGSMDIRLKLFGLIPIKSVTVDVIPGTKLIPVGKTVGIQIQTDGIMVLGTGVVKGVDGKEYEPCKGVLQSGDLIIGLDGRKLNDKEELIQWIEESNKTKHQLEIKRQDKVLETTIQTVKSKEDQENKLGIWVRDSTQGIGTITYIDPNNLAFGALGHGINDIDTNQLMSISEGKIMNAKITSIKKGEKGNPGELSGMIYDDEDNSLGKIQLNTTQGIFGRINTDTHFLSEKDALPIALKNEVVEGPATILSNIEGHEIKEYTVYIYKLTPFNNSANKGMLVKITDKDLLEKTNGIIQGMSGSPIIQNGKLIGAVTHVFVQDPSKGYGIYIENMMNMENKMSFR